MTNSTTPANATANDTALPVPPPTALARNVNRHGNVLQLGRRRLTVTEILCKDGFVLATLNAPGASYLAVRCASGKAIGKPNAEFWAVQSSKSTRHAFHFAVDDDEVFVVDITQN